VSLKIILLMQGGGRPPFLFDIDRNRRLILMQKKNISCRKVITARFIHFLENAKILKMILPNFLSWVNRGPTNDFIHATVDIMAKK
jgi:hypothetical protein